MSAPTLNPPTVEAEARALTRENQEDEPAILHTYWFPHPNEVRLIHVDPTNPPSEAVTPFYFSANGRERRAFVTAIALIRPEEEGAIPLPTGWGRWDEAIVWNPER